MNYWSRKNQKELDELIKEKGVLDTYVFLLSIFYKLNFVALPEKQQYCILHGIQLIQKIL